MRRLSALVLLAPVALSAMAGCTSSAEAGPSQLINGFASKVDKATQRTWTAEYKLTNGQSVTMVQAQKPVRTAYVHPAGRLVIKPEGPVRCAPACAATTSQTPDVPGFVTPAQALRAITDATLGGGTLTSTDTTLAGQHAQCLAVNGLTACVTDLGVLGSFVGVIDGQPVDLALSSYTETAADSAFAGS